MLQSNRVYLLLLFRQLGYFFFDFVILARILYQVFDIEMFGIDRKLFNRYQFCLELLHFGVITNKRDYS